MAVAVAEVAMAGIFSSLGSPASRRGKGGELGEAVPPHNREHSGFVHTVGGRFRRNKTGTHVWTLS